MTNYWVVGANWEGTDLYEEFVSKGYWEMGWTDEQKPDFAKLRDQMQIDDRIAIKKCSDKVPQIFK